MSRIKIQKKKKYKFKLFIQAINGIFNHKKNKYYLLIEILLLYSYIISGFHVLGSSLQIIKGLYEEDCSGLNKYLLASGKYLLINGCLIISSKDNLCSGFNLNIFIIKSLASILTSLGQHMFTV